MAQTKKNTKNTKKAKGEESLVLLESSDFIKADFIKADFIKVEKNLSSLGFFIQLA